METEETKNKLKEISSQWISDDYDLLAYRIVEWVKTNITYQRDYKTWNKLEYWQTAEETLNKRTGDCEDMAILCYHLCKSAGIPIWRLQLCAGEVYDPYSSDKLGGHCWLQIISPKINDFVNVDAAYYANESMNDLLMGMQASVNQKYKNIWVSFNEEKIIARHTSNFIDNPQWE